MLRSTVVFPFICVIVSCLMAALGFKVGAARTQADNSLIVAKITLQCLQEEHRTSKTENQYIQMILNTETVALARLENSGFITTDQKEQVATLLNSIRTYRRENPIKFDVPDTASQSEKDFSTALKQAIQLPH